MSHTVNVLVTDIILNITSPKTFDIHIMYIGSRPFELFSKCNQLPVNRYVAILK